MIRLLRKLNSDIYMYVIIPFKRVGHVFLVTHLFSVLSLFRQTELKLHSNITKFKLYFYLSLFYEQRLFSLNGNNVLTPFSTGLRVTKYQFHTTVFLAHDHQLTEK